MKTLNYDTNLIDVISENLRKKISDFNVYSIWIECNELNLKSEYPLNYSYYTAIANELITLGYKFEI